MISVFAYTGREHFYPPFISVNEHSQDKVTVTVRGPHNYQTQTNPWAEAEVPKEQLVAMAREILKRYG